ncbi:DNA-binding SARP family transcriptional activator [Actinomadura pelletieri DSM 43383]|uniref:DNA-binding SARP family transcriptional activator n=1 Tax=Actinomadura pelletieri DSM 43383 TaxID=1120940 RepID=A0A495QTZ4_9ACTN|nr:BTAD domain-containing putative transcriptional regulator [Actinomadura pelletieri]RKS76928.1 DNA-binding SARP family transcriptional activator [Actinomadura pelletieri DSM 43383]
MEFRILGPLHIVADGRPVDVGGPQQQAVLAALLLAANQVVPIDRLVDAVWWTSPPSARANVRGYIAALRRALRNAGEPADRLITRSPGYLLRVEPGELDLARFEELFARGERAFRDGRVEEAARDFAEALDSCRGRPLEAMSLGAPLLADVERLEERRLLLMEQYTDACLRLGRSDALVPDLRRLTARHPLRERLWERLMLVLYRAGRSADALDAYARVREHLADELGIDPGPRLRALERQIISGDPILDDTVQSTPPPNTPPGTVRQLPMDIVEFTGREEELRALNRLADDAGGDGGTALTAIAIEGMAGVGKTRLAVRAAHQISARGRFGALQLWADLRAMDPDLPAADPAEVLGGFLRQLNVPPAQIPAGVGAMAALYRDRLHGERALVILDDATDEAQVEPLLPGDPTSLVLITSRRSLAGLDGVHRFQLDGFAPRESRDLMGRIAGHERVTADDAATARIAERCGQLPMAVTMAARRLQTRPAWTPAEFDGRLADEDRLPGELEFRNRSISASFEPSYRALTDDQKRMFRLLGLHPAADFTPSSAAALADLPRERAEPLLEALLDENLLRQATPGRYRLHHLLRVYARKKARAEEGADLCDAAVGRVCAWYLGAARSADEVLNPHGRRIEPPAGSGGESGGGSVAAPAFGTRSQALAWLDAEADHFAAVVKAASGHGHHPVVWRLSALLLPVFRFRRSRDEWVSVYQTGLRTARRLGEWPGIAAMLTGLALACSDARCFGEAAGHHREALLVQRRLGDLEGQARSLNGLAAAYLGDRQPRRAVECLAESASVLRRLRDPLGGTVAGVEVKVEVADGGHVRVREALTRPGTGTMAVAARSTMADRPAPELWTYGH